MVSHPMTFLIGYLVGAFVLSFVVIGPVMVLIITLFADKHEKRYWKGVYYGAATTAFIFMILHYLLYLRGYTITNWTEIPGDIFYPPLH